MALLPATEVVPRLTFDGLINGEGVVCVEGLQNHTLINSSTTLYTHAFEGTANIMGLHTCPPAIVERLTSIALFLAPSKSVQVTICSTSVKMKLASTW